MEPKLRRLSYDWARPSETRDIKSLLDDVASVLSIRYFKRLPVLDLERIFSG